MGKPWKRHKVKRDKANHGPCFVKDCTRNGSLLHHCKVCEALAADPSHKKTADECFTVAFCGHHVVEANKEIKKHVLLKHPMTIPAWMASKLLGES